MDLQTSNYNNNNDETSSWTNKEVPQGGIRHRLQLQPPPLPPVTEEEKKEQFEKEKKERNQVPHDSSLVGDVGTNSFKCTAQVSEAWWREEGSWSCFRMGEIGNEMVVEELDLEKDQGNCLAESHLVRVDPIVEFFTVDEEFLGTFRIVTGSLARANVTNARKTGSLDGVSGGQQKPQQAVIFKVKTTTPSCFRVCPTYGLVKPNVISWITVKCNTKANAGQFLVEVCPVPGAIAAMTSDLYTTRVKSNLCELESIWKRVEHELGESRLRKELHRVVCRFQRPDSVMESASNNNVPDNDDLQAQSLEFFQLAREGAFSLVSPSENKEECQKEDRNVKGKKVVRDNVLLSCCCCCSSCCCRKCQCDSARKLGYLSFMLVILLLIALGYIVYHEYSYYYRFWNVERSSNNKGNINR